MSSAHARSLALLPALVIACAIGCTTDAADDEGEGLAGGEGTGGDGTGGAATGEGGAGGVGTGGDGTGGESSTVCDCSLASLGCGSSLAQEAEASGCVIPLLPEHSEDLLACSDGEWSVEASCDMGCEVGSGDTPDACEGLALVSMDLVVVQSQVEPYRGDQPALPGDFDVEQVQMALVDENIDVTVDGWFGNDTANGYASWQESLGYSGLGANGIPGPSSLAALGVDRFEIQNKILVGQQTTYTGKTVNQRTRDMLAEADAMVAHSIVVTQGSYNAGGVAASGGTHDGGGAIDISVAPLSTTQRWQTVKALRTVGFAAWLRTPSQGPWPYHIHAIAVGDTDVSISARNQVADYYVGKNGLASHAGDNTPADYQVPFTWWEKYEGN